MSPYVSPFAPGIWGAEEVLQILEAFYLVFTHFCTERSPLFEVQGIKYEIGVKALHVYCGKKMCFFLVQQKYTSKSGIILKIAVHIWTSKSLFPCTIESELLIFCDIPGGQAGVISESNFDIFLWSPISLKVVLNWTSANPPWWLSSISTVMFSLPLQPNSGQ